jgi:hypothetical protein
MTSLQTPVNYIRSYMETTPASTWCAATSIARGTQGRKYHAYTGVDEVNAIGDRVPCQRSPRQPSTCYHTNAQWWYKHP